MLNKMWRPTIFILAILFSLSLMGLTTVTAIDAESLAIGTLFDPPEDFWDNLVSQGWKFVNPALSMPPATVFIWNH